MYIKTDNDEFYQQKIPHQCLRNTFIKSEEFMLKKILDRVKPNGSTSIEIHKVS